MRFHSYPRCCSFFLIVTSISLLCFQETDGNSLASDDSGICAAAEMPDTEQLRASMASASFLRTTPEGGVKEGLRGDLCRQKRPLSSSTNSAHLFKPRPAATSAVLRNVDPKPNPYSMINGEADRFNGVLSSEEEQNQRVAQWTSTQAVDPADTTKDEDEIDNCCYNNSLERQQQQHQKNRSSSCRGEHEDVEHNVEGDYVLEAPVLPSSHSGLLRLFESRLFTMRFAVQYLAQSREAGVLAYIGNRMFAFDDADVAFYLPQLVCLYVHNADVADAIKQYLVAR